VPQLAPNAPKSRRPGVASRAVKERTMCLVKWRGLPYANATWEWQEDCEWHAMQETGGRRSAGSAAGWSTADTRPPASSWKPYDASPAYPDGRALRDYQLEGLNWLVYSWYQVRSAAVPADLHVCDTRDFNRCNDRSVAR
jgi:chromodomain-helicase-DNA-binding protein 7